jgi:thimet oligopeptidase
MGVILLDLFPRAGKASHVGMCCELIPLWAPLDATVYPGSALIVGNFTKPTSERPSLMTHSEATTFFHEFGHAIHHLLGQSSFMSFCGCNVKTDFVEVPSILLEEWMWDAEILKKVSNHYVTGEPLSDEMIQNMIAARQFGMGGNMERLCFLSLLSLALFEDNGEIQPTAFAQEIWKRESPHVACREQYHILTSWWHVPEYGPKYYAYLWSRALAADLFEKIKQGGLLNPEMGRAYVETILSKGGSRDPYQLLSDFLGRKPTLDAFFKQL